MCIREKLITCMCACRCKIRTRKGGEMEQRGGGRERWREGEEGRGTERDPTSSFPPPSYYIYIYNPIWGLYIYSYIHPIWVSTRPAAPCACGTASSSGLCVCVCVCVCARARARVKICCSVPQSSDWGEWSGIKRKNVRN